MLGFDAGGRDLFGIAAIFQPRTFEPSLERWTQKHKETLLRCGLVLKIEVLPNICKIA